VPMVDRITPLFEKLEAMQIAPSNRTVIEAEEA